MALSKGQKIAVGIGIAVALVGAGLYLRKRMIDKAKKKCADEGGLWDSKKNKCMPNPLKDLLAKSLTDVNFKTGSADLTASSLPYLDTIAKSLADYPELLLTITGHTDSDGAEEYNQALSEKRAESVKTYLVKKGIGDNKIATIGKGETEPIAPNDTKEGKDKNRRVVFALSVAN
jgi:outer membrane protein OmpA-like peptidoglycan-associated protein